MSTRSTIIMAVLLALLGTLYYFREKVTAPTDEELKSPKLFDFLPEEVTKLDVTTMGTTVQMQKENGVWRVVAPYKSLAALSDITSVATQMGTLKADRVVAEDVAPGLLKQYGLDKPKLKISATLTTGKPAVTVMMGARTPGETGWYVMTPDNDDVYVGGNTLTFVVTKKPDDWRERAVLSFEPDKIDRIVLEGKGQTVQLEQAKEGTDWSLVQPTKQKAESEEIRKYLNTVKGIRIESFVDKSPPVVKPEYTLKLWNKGDRDPQTLIVGGPTKGGFLATRGSDKNREVFVLNPLALQTLRLDPGTVADRHLFNFVVDTVSGATIFYAGSGEVRAEKKGGTWGYISPTTKPDDMGRVPSLAYAISQQKFDRRVTIPAELANANRALAKPVARFVLTDDKGAAIAGLEVDGFAPGGRMRYVRKVGTKEVYVADVKFADEWKAIIAAVKAPAPKADASAAPTPIPAGKK